MYCPAHFEENHPDVLLNFMVQHPLATLVTMTEQGLVADHIPMLHQPDGTKFGKLIGHVARANPLWQIAPDQEILLVFQGPSAYVSPNWYATKAIDGKVVPTWNYAIAHVYGTLNALESAPEIMSILTQLTNTHEARQTHPWKVSDAPPEFTERLLQHIVGIEISITRMLGKWKLSQNQAAENQRTISAGLRRTSDKNAEEIAGLIALRTP